MATSEPRQDNSEDLLAAEARCLMRQATHGSLATIARETGHPFATLVAVATDTAGAPVLLISELAQHTKNLDADPRCSLLISREGSDHPLADARLTLVGRFARWGEPGVRHRFLARHPDAADYANFTDFAFWRMEVEAGHFVGGFGRIRMIGGSKLNSPDDSAQFVANELQWLRRLNEMELFAPQQLAGADVPIITGIDREGFDVRIGKIVQRHTFAAQVDTLETIVVAIRDALR